MILAAVLAQLADLATWIPAILADPHGEAGVARFAASPQSMVIAKALGIAVMVVGLAALTRWRRHVAAVCIAFGLVGALSNLVNGWGTAAAHMLVGRAW